MKRTGAILLSVMMVLILTVSNLAGAYHTAARVYAAEEETIGGGDNQEGESIEPQGQDASGGLGDDTTSLVGDTTTVPAGEGESLTNPQNPALGQGDSQVLSTGDVATSPAPAPVTMFTVCFDANGHGTAPGAVSVVAGECIEKPADPSADGFLFTGWYRDADAMSAWNFDVDTVNGDITLYAGWAELTTGTPGTNAAITYTVTFDANGHGTAPQAVTVNEGETITEPAAPTENGFIFTGWYKDTDATDAWDFNSFTVTGDLTLYAGWTQNMQRAMRNTPVLRNGSTSFAESIEFTGTAGGVFDVGNHAYGSNYYNNARFYGIRNNHTEKIILDSLPTSQHFDILLRNGGSCPVEISPGGSVDIQVSLKQNLDADSYQENLTFTFSSGETTATKSVTAKGVVYKEFNITVTSGEGGSAWSHFQRAGSGTTVVLETKPDEGYIFKEWQVVSGGNITITPSYFIMGNEDVVVKAIFEKAYRVTVTNGGYGTASASVAIGAAGTRVTLTSNPDTGYLLKEWQVNKGGVTVENNSFIIGDKDVEVHAVFERDPGYHFVTVTSNGYGTVEASAKGGKQGELITLTATPQSGYSFDKWDVISGGVTVENNQFNIGTEDVEVKAIFKYDPTNHFIKIDPSLQNLKFGKPVMLRISEGGLSNGTITWTSSDPSTLSISGNEATFHKTGTVTITASQAADGEFAAVSDSLEVTVGKGDASSIDWPTPGPVYTKIVYRDVALNGGSTEFGSFAWKNPYGTENRNPGSSSGSRVVFSPKAELASYFEADISQWLTFTVQARDTLDSCISVSPNTIDFGTVEQKNLDVLTEIFITVNNLTNLSVAAFVDITPGDNDYFKVRNASGGSSASPGDGIRFGIKPKTTLAPGTYEVPITFTAATNNESVEKTLTAKIVVKDNLPEASVTISPDITKFDLTEGYDPDKVAQTITLTNTGQKPLEITDYAFKGGIYTFDLELISTSSTIPAGGTAQYRIKPKPGQTYPGYALISYHSLRFTLKDSDGQQSAKETAVTMKVSEYVDYFGALTVSPNTVDFGTETVGYQMLPEQTVVFSNHNIVGIRGNRFPRSSNYILRFWQEDLRMINSDVVIAPGIRARMTVAPRQDLPAGTYDETLEIEFYNYWGEMETRTVNLKFTVEKAESTVTVTGDGNGTASASSPTAKDRTIVSLSATPNDGYLFSHWEVISGGVTLDDTNSQMTAFKIGKDDVSVKAHFTAIPTGEYRISVVTDGHGSASSDPKSGTTRDDVKLSAKAAEGYYFVRWEVVSGGVQIADATNPKPQRPAFKIGDSDVEIRAVFAKNPYQVLITVEGLGTAEAAPDSGRAGDTVSLTATPREYYRFKEWRITSGSGTIADKASATTTFTFAGESAEVKAVFEAIPYGVDVDRVGEGTVEELPGTYNDEFMLTAVPADGYKFYMWEVVDRSTGVITAVGSTNKAFIGVKCYAERIKMRVTFITIPYSISYTLNGGTNASGNPDTYTVKDTIVLAEPGRDGFTFDGWYDASGKKITTIQEGTTGDLTFEARWSPRPYTITYNLDGGSNHPDNPATYTVETETITLKEPTKGVMIFDGWYDAGGNKVTQIVKNSTGDITLTARWKKAPAPAITFPTASDITYGQTLADSVLTGGSTEYGTFMWKMPSFVPMAGNIGWDLEFIPSADTEKYYEPIADADKTAKVKVRVNAATPALTVSAEKKDATTASLTATVQKAGEGMAPRGTVKFEVSEDHGANWTVIASGIA